MNFLSEFVGKSKVEILWSLVKDCGSARDLCRIRAFLENGYEKPAYSKYGQLSSHGYFPGLEARPWHDPLSVEHIDGLLSHFKAMKTELQDVKRARAYGQQWASDTLVENGQWDIFHLHLMGQPSRAAQRLCPITTEKSADLPGSYGKVFLSALKPKTHIKPHHDATNTCLRLHLGLETPAGCSIRVGDEWKSWEPGKLLLFDGSFEHEVIHNGAEIRWVLIIDVWHPGLSMAERKALRRLSYLRSKDRDLRKTLKRIDRKIYKGICTPPHQPKSEGVII